MARADGIDALMGLLVLIWGTAFVTIKVLGTDLDPFQIMWFRFLPFLVLFGAWILVRRRARLREVTGPDWLRFLAMGGLGVAGYHIPVNIGLVPDGTAAELSAATGAVLIATTPLWTMLFSILAGKEGFDRTKAAWSGIAFAGVVVLIFYGKGEIAEFTATRRALILLLAPILWSWYSIIGKPIVDRYGALFTTGVAFCVGTLLLLPYGVTTGIEPLRVLSASQLAWLAYLSLAATVAGYAMWNQALKYRSATELTTYIYFIPVVATAAGWFLLRETVTVWFLLGALLVILGVVQVQRRRMAAAPPEITASPDATGPRP